MSFHPIILPPRLESLPTPQGILMLSSINPACYLVGASFSLSAIRANAGSDEACIFRIT
jgi:hypothetical protein